MRDSFIDKVYDTYLSEDFTYGEDNLNPIREIDTSQVKSLDDKISEIYAELNKRIVKVKKAVSSISNNNDDPNEGELYQGNTVVESNISGDDSRRRQIARKAGSSGTSILKIPGVSDEDDILSMELELKLLESIITSTYPGDKKDDKWPPDNEDINEIPLVPEKVPQIFQIDCSGTFRDSTGKKVSKEDVDDDADFFGDVLDDDADDDEAEKSENQLTAKSSNDNLKDAVQEARNQFDKRSIQNEVDIKKCAQAEIGILKMILAVCKVIRMVKQVIDPAMIIARQAVELVQLAAQCWNNPSCLATILERVMGTLVAFLMSIVAQLLADIWKLLGMDCMTAQAAQIIDEIKGALAGIKNIVSELDPTGIITECKDLASDMKDAVNTSIDNAKNFQENMEESFKSAKDVFENQVKDAASAILGVPISKSTLLETFNSDFAIENFIHKLKRMAKTDEQQSLIGAVDTAYTAIQAIQKARREWFAFTKIGNKTKPQTEQIVNMLQNPERY